MKKHIDPYSGESFIPKRSNQRFAYKAHQIAFNNAKAKKERDLHAYYDSQIKKNWKILKAILKNKKATIQNQDYLLGKGYSFRFFNNLRTNEDKSFYGVYDYGIRSLANGKYEIINFNHE
ncbi:hypothetical protein N9E11_01025 [Crocinitomicaceae bacterium]|nr:hypothetical protein [Crocinitomicaceae bacterium]